MGNLAELFISFILASGQWAVPIQQASALDPSVSVQEPIPAGCDVPRPVAGRHGPLLDGRGAAHHRGQRGGGRSGGLAAEAARRRRAGPDPLVVPEAARGVPRTALVGWPGRQDRCPVGWDPVGRDQLLRLAWIATTNATRTVPACPNLAGCCPCGRRVGAGIGGVTGALIGALVKDERWDKVDLPPIRVGVTPPAWRWPGRGPFVEILTNPS